MKFKIKKGIVVCVACILSILFIIQIPAQAETVDDEGSFVDSNVELPSAYSNQNLATPVRNEGDNNDSWACATMDCLEMLLKHNNAYTSNLSTSHLKFAASYNSDGSATSLTQKEYLQRAMGYLASWRGAKNEEDFPNDMSYENYSDLDAQVPISAGVNNIMRLDGADIDTVKTAISDYGSVLAAFYSANVFYTPDTYAYYYNSRYGTYEPNRAVCIVGWDDDYAISNFGRKPKNPGAWLCKNSKGSEWGNEGYFWLSYETSFLETVCAFMDYQQSDNDVKIYQNEISGADEEFSRNNATYVNMFEFNDDFSEDYVTIDKISFETESVGADYSIYYIPQSIDGYPAQQKNKWVLLYSGTVDHKGYNIVDIDDVDFRKGRKVSIGIKIDGTIGQSTTESEEYPFGNSYVVFDNKDISETDTQGLKRVIPLNHIVTFKNMCGTFSIKAVAKKFEKKEDGKFQSYYSSKDLGYTTSVTNQGSFGLCWAHSAINCLETLVIKNGDGEILKNADENSHLSPLHMSMAITCKYDPIYSRYDYTTGGEYKHSLSYFTSWRGAKAAQLFPNDLDFNEFGQRDAEAETVIAGVNSALFLGYYNFHIDDPEEVVESNRNEVKDAIIKYGSVLCDYLHDSKFLDEETGSSYYSKELPGYMVMDNNHAVCIVGWDDNYSKSNFNWNNQPKKNGAWLVKNSWGEDWGDDGYFWMSYEERTLNFQYALMDYQLPDDNIKLYQVERGGYNTPGFSRDNATFVNVFDFADDYTVIDKINFETVSNGNDYFIYYIPMSEDDPSVPDTDQSNWKLIYDSTENNTPIDHKGYISVDIKDFPVENGKVAIGIKIQGDTSDWNCEIGTYKWRKAPELAYEGSYCIYDDGSNVEKLATNQAFILKAIAKKFVNGSVDDDFELTIIDATMIQRYLAEMIEFDEAQMKAGDFNQSGTINVKDVTAIQRCLAGLQY